LPLAFQDVEKETAMLKEENSKLKLLAKNLVENIVEPAAKKGDAGAIQALGECHEHGLGGKKQDGKKAQECYEKGVLAENPASQCSLGVILMEENNDVKANERGVELLKKSAAAGHPKGQRVIACRQMLGSLVAKDEKGAVELLKKAASAGSEQSQYELGAYYENVEKDVKQAEHWYLEAAESGEVGAQFKLGYLYKNNEKLKDVNKAIEWYEKAYENGRCNEASVALVGIFEHLNNDIDKVIEWSYRANDSNRIGVLLSKKDWSSFKSTIKCCFRSAIHRNNMPQAYNNLGVNCLLELRPPLLRRATVLGASYGMYYYALTLPEDNPKRLKLIRQAAVDTDVCPYAQWELGELYETGRCGLEKNAVLAKEWKDKARANGYKPPA
jgi:TPR repeat protein